MESKKSRKVVRPCAGVRGWGGGGSLKSISQQDPEGQRRGIGHTTSCQGARWRIKVVRVHLYDLLDVLDLLDELHLCHPPDVLELPD